MRRILALTAALVLAAAPAARSAEPGLERASIAELSGRMAAGRLTAEALARFYLGRIAGMDRNGPACTR